MELGGFNGSEESSADEILFTRGRRPKRRRPTCPPNLRDVISDSGSSSEEIEPFDTPPSLLPPTPTSFNLSHHTAFPSRRSNDTLSSFTSPDIPGTSGDSTLAPSTSNTPSNSWLSSQKASERFQQAADEPNEGQGQPPPNPNKGQSTSSTKLNNKPSAESSKGQSKSPSPTKPKKGQGQPPAEKPSKGQGQQPPAKKLEPPGTSRGTRQPPIPSPLGGPIGGRSRLSLAEEFKARKLSRYEQIAMHIEKTKSVFRRSGGKASLEGTALSVGPSASTDTNASLGRDSVIQTSSVYSLEVPTAPDDPTQDELTEDPAADSPQLQPLPTVTLFHLHRHSNGSLGMDSVLQASSVSSLEVPQPLPPPETSCWRQNKTLQRFLAAFKQGEDLPDGVDISSDEEEDNLSVGDGDDQLDSEWLELSKTDILNMGDTEELPPLEPPKARPANRVSALYCSVNFTKKLLPVFQALFYLGRFPFQMDVSNEDIKDIPRFKYNRKSWRYFLFVGTSLLSFLTAILMMANFYKISTAIDPLTVYEAAIRLEQDKYWVEATLEVVSLLFLAISGVSMLEYGGGTSIVDFLSRWSTSFGVIRYDVTSGLRKMTIAFFWCYGIYAGTFVVLFFAGGQSIPTVRGSCGFNGLLILNSFTEELRFRPGFKAVEFLGLFVHLYTTLATSLVTLVICMHCWALDNAAKRFNRRLEGCLRQLSFRNPAAAAKAYPKIFAEHLVITSFPRQIGKVFRLTFIAYLTGKTAELIVTLFSLAEPIVNGFPNTNHTFFNVSQSSQFDPHKGVPLLVVEPSHVHSLKSLFYFAKACLSWLIFMEIVLKPGTSLARGAGLIVRNYLTHCKTSHALRFITSMEFSFNSRTVFNVNPGVQLNRAFMAKFVGFVLAIIITLLQFIPSAVNPRAAVICDHFGECSVFRFPSKSRSRDVFRDSIGKVLSKKFHETTERPLPPIQLQLPSFVLAYPPCLSTGRLARRPPTFAFKCQQNSSHPVYIPTYFRKLRDGKFLQVPPTPDRSCVQSSNLTKGETLFDCFGDRVFSLETDECGNPKLPVPDETGAKKFPILRAVRLNREIFCCFVYSGLENQAERCNLLSTGTHSCSRKSGTPGRKIHEESIVQMWNKSSEAVVDNHLPLWTGCLCQGLEGLPVSSTACTVPPTTTAPPPGNKPELPCPLITGPNITGHCNSCPDPRSLFRKYFLATCPIKGRGNFSVPSVVNIPDGGNGTLGPLLSPPCAPRASTSSPASSDAPHYDCYGNRVNVSLERLTDDCGTLRVPFPSRYNGTRKLPEMKVQWIQVNVSSGSYVEFVCCWDYSEWRDVQYTCNLYPDSILHKVCGFRTARTHPPPEAECNQIVMDNENVNYAKKCGGTSVNYVCDNGII